MSSSTIYNQSRPRGVRPNRNGFTLTELLIAITIIGLLVGLLAVAGSGVINSSREFAVNSEVIQLSQTVENFKTKFGFYPPSFEQFKRTVNTGDVNNASILAAEAAQILPFLNKIAPNHRELEPSPTGNGRTRLMDWWEHVGCNLDQTTSLQFWLSGLCENKQFPLTGGLTTATGSPVSSYMPVGYGVEVHVDGSDIPGGLSRESLFEFDTTRFLPVDIIDDDNSNSITRPVVQYNMDHGKSNGFLFYVYRDSDSYLPVAQPSASGTIADHPNGRMETLNPATPAPSSSSSAYPGYLASNLHRGLAYHFLSAGSLEPTFANPNTFQIISFGLDGEAGTQNETSAPITVNRSPALGGPYVLQPAEEQQGQDRGNVLLALPSSNDNLCNFSGGRLDKFKIDNNLE